MEDDIAREHREENIQGALGRGDEALLIYHRRLRPHHPHPHLRGAPPQLRVG